MREYKSTIARGRGDIKVPKKKEAEAKRNEDDGEKERVNRVDGARIEAMTKRATGCVETKYRACKYLPRAIPADKNKVRKGAKKDGSLVEKTGETAEGKRRRNAKIAIDRRKRVVRSNTRIWLTVLVSPQLFSRFGKKRPDDR